MQRAFAVAGLVVVVAAGLASADDGSCFLEVRKWARPTKGPDYVGYYVGGGAACRGEPRFANEGTWGWDYSGSCFHRDIYLQWWHGRRYQGGSGKYESNGGECHVGERIHEKMEEKTSH